MKLCGEGLRGYPDPPRGIVALSRVVKWTLEIDINLWLDSG